MFQWLLDWINGPTKPAPRPGAAPTGSIIFPQLPDRYAGVIEASSGADPGRAYQIDLITFACTCPDFRRHRQKLPPRHAGRICKHVSEQLRETGAIEEYDGLHQAIARVGRGKANYVQRRLGSGAEVVFGYDTGAPWIDVLVPEGDGYWRYGYHPGEERWAYSEEPEEAEAIQSMVAAARIP